MINRRFLWSSLALPIASALAACQPTVSAPIAREQSAPSLPAPPGDAGGQIDPWADDAKIAVQEQRALVGAPARRIGDTLVLSLSNGQELKRQSRHCSEENSDVCGHAYLMAYLPRQGVFVLLSVGYEDYNYWIIDVNTGVETDLPEYPFFAPSGDVVATLGNEKTSVVVWRKKAGDWASEKSFQLDETVGNRRAWMIKGWRTDDVLDVEEGPVSAADARLGPRLLQVTRGAKGWEIGPPRRPG